MIEILTSGVALGVHVPGLLLADRLREHGIPARVRVLERLLPERTLATTAGMKWAFHQDFRLALAGQRIASDPFNSATGDAADELLDAWGGDAVRRFVVFSGFWLPLLERFAATHGDLAPVDLCHVDSVASPSFREAGRSAVRTRDVWLADHATGRVPQSIPVSRAPALQWAERDRRLLVHGGGWGIGTYRRSVRDLRDQGLELDVVAYEHSDVSAEDPGVRYHLIDPEWHPWLDNGYPPFGRAVAGRHPRYTRGRGYHGSFDLVRAAVATVSKPGGGTLLDSLWAATPTVLLEPFGEHEKKNTELWRRLGFGTTFSEWKETGFDMDLIEEMHHRIRAAAANVPDYSRMLAELAGGRL